MKPLLALGAWILGCLALQAQTVRLEGIVFDANQQPLEMANVMAVNTQTNAMDSYAITSDKGKYILQLKPNTSYTIKVSYLGMKNKTFAWTTAAQAQQHNIQMESAGIELNSVEVVKEMPVSIKGDTLIYNADSFKVGTEKKLEDVLKKLPGVEVNADGQIQVEGKTVSKLMVEGKDFFDGDTKLGVKNIPADAVDKVQVLRNYSEISALKGVENNQENVAMNIQLKEGKKNFWFGDITAGGGRGFSNDRYLLNPKVFYYNPKFSVNTIVNINNIGDLPLTVQDYFKLTGGFRNFMQKGGSSFNVASNDLGIAMLRNNRAKQIDTKFGATNFSYSPIKTWTLSGFSIYSSSLTDLQTASQSTLVSTGLTQNNEENTRQNSQFSITKLSSTFKPNSKLQWDYDIIFKRSRQQEDSQVDRNVLTPTGANSDQIITYKKQNPTSVNQNLGLFYTPSDKHIWAIESQHLYQNEDPLYRANVQRFPFLINDFDYTQQRSVANQGRFVQTQKWDAKLDYYYVMTSKSNLNLTLANTYSNQHFDSHIFQYLDNGAINDIQDPKLNNRVSYLFNNTSLGLHVKWLTGKFTFTPGFTVHHFDMNNVQSDSDYRTQFNRVLPDFFALYQIKKAETLTYNFAITNNFTDINQLVEGYVLSNYSSLYKGNRMLINATAQTHSLRYFKFNMFNQENISAFINYSRQTDAIQSAVSFFGPNQTSSAINSMFPAESWSGRGQYGRSFSRYYKVNGSVNANRSVFFNTQNGETLKSINFTHTYNVKVSTLFKKWPNVELGYAYTINDFSGGRSSKFFTDSPTARIDYYFLNGFAWVAEYEFYHYYNSDKSVNNEYAFLNASLNYQQKDSPWEFKVGVTNILDTRSLNDNNFNQFQISNSQYIVQPRYALLYVKYNL